jgi:hypothetical protein
MFVLSTYIESKKVGYNWPHGALERPLRSYIHILYHGKILFSIFLRLQQVAKVSLNGVVIDTASSVREVYTLGRSGIFLNTPKSSRQLAMRLSQNSRGPRIRSTVQT